MAKTILFGTNNAHKLREIREIVGHQYEVRSLADQGLALEVEETETTLQGNALLKAQAFYEASGLPTFADDTGLEVVALDGAPGVYSARYAGEGCSFADNVNKLLRELGATEQRAARFRTVIAYVGGGELRFFEGEVRGVITKAPQGEGGFGYDPVFLPEGGTLTFAEMAPEAKNAISHRGRAVRAFADFLMAEQA